MANFLDRFPRILYNNNTGGLSNYSVITNIMFRVGFLRDIENAAAYYYYTIRDGDTPEILAEKIYGNAEAYWILFYANGIYDPFYDWPLADKPFYSYMAAKYRSKAESFLGSGLTDQQVVNWTQDTTSANSVHHYEKQIARVSTTDDNTVMLITVEVDGERVAQTVNSSLPIADDNSSAGRGAWQYYAGEDARALEFTNSFETFENVGGKTIVQQTRGVAITYWDYEHQLNENKRQLKVIKSEYYPQIIKEYNELTKSAPSYLRRLT